jgi:quercetin dioxygenase-like cupin family protein
MPRTAQLDEMVARGLEALQTTGGVPGFPKLDGGRAKATFASPDDGSSSDLAVSVIALPPGFVNPAHSHEPEELLIVLRGTGKVIIDGETELDVADGTVALIPPRASHSVVASIEGPLLLLAVVARSGNDQGASTR